MFQDNFGQVIIEAFSIFSSIFFQNHLKYFPKFSQKLHTGFFNLIRCYYFLKVTLKTSPHSFLKIYPNFPGILWSLTSYQIVPQNFSIFIFLKYFLKFSGIIFEIFRNFSQNFLKKLSPLSKILLEFVLGSIFQNFLKYFSKISEVFLEIFRNSLKWLSKFSDITSQNFPKYFSKFCEILL